MYGEWPSGEQRISSIEDHLLLAEKLTDLGYFAVRMGKYVAKPISCPKPHVIDYPTKHHSDFLDMYLSARCAFFVTDFGGMLTLPSIFRKPMAVANVFPPGVGTETCSYRDGIFIPKMVFSSDADRLLTLRETLEQSFSHLGLRNEAEWASFNSMGFKLLDNTPEEIAELGIELDQRVKSNFVQRNEDRALQNEWLSIIRSYPKIVRLEPGRDQTLTLGSHFLRTHKEWLN